MINFQALRYRNFLSTGDRFTEIDLARTTTTLVVGQNGSGKSTMLDALSFALFGKAHRNINKGQLVNSINNKGTVVEVEFVVHKQQFKVVRGLKPAIFEIWRDDKLINQDSHAKEYQKILEQNIIKLNHKSFHQIVVLGSSSFIPFMQLPSHSRREIIEDLLDINVFSKMNSLLKEKTSALKDTAKENDHKLELCKAKTEAHKKYIRNIHALNVSHKESKQKEIQSIRDDIKEATALNSDQATNAVAVGQEIKKSIETWNDKKTQVQSFLLQFKQQIKSVVKESKFYEDNEDCPTCEQPIKAELKDKKISEARSRAKGLQEGIATAEEQLTECDENIPPLKENLEAWQRDQAEVESRNRQIIQWQDRLTDLEEEIDNLQAGGEDLSKANDDLRTLEAGREELLESKYKITDQLQYNQVTTELLKDTGIKTKIIKQYLPVINKLTNQYLQVLDFFIHFDLDESFKETIRSRHRDAFSYDSFSEGEKQRIDLALLFTWRMVAKMKNSVATNLLILDETFDSSLDHEGVDNLMKILDTLGDETNVFVISHKGDMLDGKFESKIEFVKDKNFSKIK